MLSSYVVMSTSGEEIVRVQSEGKLGAAAFSPDGQRLAIIGAERPARFQRPVVFI